MPGLYIITGSNGAGKSSIGPDYLPAHVLRLGRRNRDRLITLLLTEPRHRFEELAAIQCPVLVMAGQKDIIKEPHTRQIAAHIKNSRLLIFPGGTHYEPWEHPDLFNKAVLDFLEDNR